MRNVINTVTGPISPEKLGRTFMHEHFVFGFPGFEYDISTGKQTKKADAIAKCIDDAKILKSQGYDTVIDATPADCGRYPEWLAEISVKSGIQIICATGYYGEGFSASGYWNQRIHCGGAEEEYAELLEAELTNGIGETGIKAGFIKLSSGHNAISNFQKMMFKGAAIAQNNTNCVIYTHTEDGELGFDQARLFLKYGAKPEKIVIGHMCGEIRTYIHELIMDWGFNIGFDRFGAYDDTHLTDEIRAKTIKKLIDNGYGDRIVVSQDAICKRLGRPVVWPGNEAYDWRNYYFGYFHENIIPLMKNEYGVTQEEIDKLFISNPKRIFG